MKADQLEKGWSAFKKNKSKSGRWWLKFWRKRAERRDLKKNLDNAEKKHTQGYEW